MIWQLCHLTPQGFVHASMASSACSTTKHNITAYPGEAFQIPVVAVGQQFGTVPFTVHVMFILVLF